MLFSSLLLAATALAAPAQGCNGRIQVKNSDLCLSSADRVDRDAPLQLSRCAADGQGQTFTWEPASVYNDVEHFRIRSAGGLCIASKIAQHSYSFGAPVLGPCEEPDDTMQYRKEWAKDGDRICMEPAKEDDMYPTSPAGLCFSAKSLSDGAEINVAKDFTGNPVHWVL